MLDEPMQVLPKVSQEMLAEMVVAGFIGSSPWVAGSHSVPNDTRPASGTE